MRMTSLLTTIILAAGKGTRMKSNNPKWANTIAGFNLLEHSVMKAKDINSTEIIGVFSESEISNIKNLNLDIKIAVQHNPRGTAHAVLSAKDLVTNNTGVILIVYCDTPLISTKALKKAVDSISSGENVVSLIGFNETRENSYGRLVADNNNLLDIIETKDNHNATNITLCNSGIVAVDAKVAWELLEKVDDKNIYNEYYLTSIVKIANDLGYQCTYVTEENYLSQGVNTKAELATLESTFQNEKRKEFLNQGVTLVDPSTTYFSLDTKIGKDVVIHPFNVLQRGTVVHDNVVIESFCNIKNSIIKNGATIGPFARIRNKSVVGENSIVGNFVELQGATLSANVKSKHLSYIGDTQINENTNIGAGVITCNYSGFSKNHTKIGKNVFVGSHVSLVAPLKIEDGAFIGAGSVITKDVSKDSLALERSNQIEIKNWVKDKNK